MITEYVPNIRFVDQQIKGPYLVWHHTHEFIEEEKGTRIIDHVKYRIPLGYLGKMINYIWVAKDLEKIFNFRQDKIIEIFRNKENDIL